MPLQNEQRLFLEVIRDLNYQANKLQEEKGQITQSGNDTEGESGSFEIEYMSPSSPLASLAAASENESCSTDLPTTAYHDTTTQNLWKFVSVDTSLNH